MSSPPQNINIIEKTPTLDVEKSEDHVSSKADDDRSDFDSLYEFEIENFQNEKERVNDNNETVGEEAEQNRV